jgi:hypothetical protein
LNSDNLLKEYSRRFRNIWREERRPSWHGCSLADLASLTTQNKTFAIQ